LEIKSNESPLALNKTLSNINNKKQPSPIQAQTKTAKKTKSPQTQPTSVINSNPNKSRYLVKNSLFKMEFDFPTPRPHFIILYNNSNKYNKFTIKDLDANEIQSIISLVQKFISTYNLTTENITLSFHTGYWVNFNLVISVLM
jgi:hypothetical protein